MIVNIVIRLANVTPSYFYQYLFKLEITLFIVNGMTTLHLTDITLLSPVVYPSVYQFIPQKIPEQSEMHPKRMVR